MSSRCPSELALETQLLQPAPEVEAHVAGCARCGERLAQMKVEGAGFDERLLHASLPSSSHAPRRWRWGGLVGATLALASAALVWPLAADRASSVGTSYVGTKGGLGLSVYVDAHGEGRLVEDGEPVPAAAALRFRVQPPAPCHLWVVSVDADGLVSRLFPAEGIGPPILDAPGALPGGVLLDGRPGPERVFAVCSPRALPFTELEQAARNAGLKGERVRQVDALPGLAGTQASVLLEKRP